MSFWSWLKENYPTRVIRYLKGLPWNFIMYFVGMTTFSMALCFGFVLTFTGHIVDGLLLLLLSGGGFITASCGWYRQFIRGSLGKVKK